LEFVPAGAVLAVVVLAVVVLAVVVLAVVVLAVVSVACVELLEEGTTLTCHPSSLFAVAMGMVANTAFSAAS
jgi:uncharacterized metal-binding protein